MKAMASPGRPCRTSYLTGDRGLQRAETRGQAPREQDAPRKEQLSGPLAARKVLVNM